MEGEAVSNELPSSNSDEQRGIQLALDPNLISLPLHSSTATPLTATAGSTADQEEADLEARAPNETTQDPRVVKTIKDNKLISNPYEIFGQMPLAQLIPIILQQRGAGFKFADLSEEALSQEIDAEENSEQGADTIKSADSRDPAENIMEISYDEAPPVEQGSQTQILPSEPSQINSGDPSVANFDNEDTEKMTQEQFVKVRKEMIEHINLAMNESSLALEFMSLLLSSARESAAITSISPFLRKTVPVGSLNSDKLPREPHSKEEKSKGEILNRGWKLRSLYESRSVLKENYMKLDSVLKKEHEYWKKIAKYINNKDVIFKLKDKRTGLRSLGIKYGYDDSGSTYKHDRGAATLRNNPESNVLELIPFSGVENTISLAAKHTEKFIRVRIFTKIESEDDYILTGESSLDKLFLNSGSLATHDLEDIRGQIKKLKAFVFEQELLYQLKRECSQLISYGVTIENENKIVMELPNEKFEIELLSLEDDSVVNHVQDAPKVNDRRATLVLTTMRMLLLIMFKKNLKQRLTSSTRGTTPNVDKDVLLLRPLLGRMRHQNYKILLRKILRDYVLDVVAGSTLKESAVYPTDPIETENIDVHVAKLSKEIRAFRHLLCTSRTKFTINIPGKGELILFLESPNFCNALVVVKYVSEPHDVSFDTKFSEFKEIEEFLHFIIAEYVKDKEVVKKDEE